MFGARRMRNQAASAYATKGDFCRIFEKDMNRLYLLSFLLTGDEAMAEQCFVGGLHIAQEGSLVFKEWAESWARRTIIQNAIRMIRPRLTSESSTVAPLSRSAGRAAADRPEITEILGLPPFERFAFVISMLEGYSDQECSLLLNCTRGDVAAARVRVLKQMGNSAELHRKFVTTEPRPEARESSSRSELRFDNTSGLAVSA